MIRARIASLFLSVAILFAPGAHSFARNQESIFERIRLEHVWIEDGSLQESVKAFSSLVASSVVSQPVDVKHYRLQIQLAPETPGITGTLTMTGETTGLVSDINVDAQQNLNIDSLRVDGVPRDIHRNNGRIVISFP